MVLHAQATHLGGVRDQGFRGWDTRVNAGIGLGLWLWLGLGLGLRVRVRVRVGCSSWGSG